MSRSTRFKTGFFAVLALVAIIAGTIAATNIFTSDSSIPQDRLARVERGDLAISVVATGKVIPITTVEIKSKATGLIQDILVEEGDRVEPGQILIKLDRELLSAQLREAEANLQAVTARLEEARAEVSSARTRKKKLQLDLDNLLDNQAFLSRQAERYQSMFEQKIVARSELERRQRELQDKVLQAKALGSEMLMQDARIQATEKAVMRVRAEVSQAEAARDRARENLAYSTIVSPIRGTVLKRYVEVGDAVSSILQLGSQATRLLTLGDMQHVYVEGRVDESDIGRVWVGQQARVRVDAYRKRTFPGKVTRIAPLGEEKDNVIGFNVRVSIQDPERILRAHMSANAEIIIEEKKNILLIPEAAVIYDRNRETFAEIYDPAAEKSRRRVPIEIGASNGTRTEVKKGLKEGQTVIKNASNGIF